VPQVTGKLQADFSSFVEAVKQSAVSLDKLNAAGSNVEQRLQKVSESFAGKNIINQATLAVEAVNRIGDATMLTEKEQKKLNDLLTEAIAKYNLLGKEAPADMVALQQATAQIKPPDPGLLSQTFSGIGDTIKSTALGMISAQAIIGGVTTAFHTLTDFVSSSVDSYASAEAAAKKMTVALQAQGTATPGVIGHFNDLAAQFQQTTVYSDDLINEMEALLTSVGDVAPAQMEKALTAATDLASGLGVDLQTATTMVAKAMEGNTASLGKYGVAIDAAKVKTEGASAVLDAIQAKFGGQAQAQLDTYAGKLEQLANNWDNVKEAVGKSLVSDNLLQLGLRTLSDQADQTSGDIDSLGESFLTLATRMTAGPGPALLVRLFEALAGGANKAAAAAKRFEAEMPTLEAFENQMAADLATFDKKHPGLDELLADAKRLANEGLKPLSAAQREVVEAYDQAGLSASKIAEKLNVSEVAVQKVMDATKQAAAASKKLADAQKEAAAAAVPLTAAQRDFAVANDRLGISAQTTATVLGVSATAITQYLEGLKNAATAQADLTKMQEEWRASAAKLQRDAEKDYTADQRKQADASGKALATQLATAEKYHDKLADLQLDSTERTITNLERERDAVIRGLTAQANIKGQLYERAAANVTAYYQHEIDVANKTDDTIVERMQARGVQTQAELARRALEARQEYEQMRAAGVFTADQIREAFHRMTAAERAASGSLADEWVASLEKIASAFTAFASVIGGPAGAMFQALGQIAQGFKSAKQAEEEWGTGGGIAAAMFSDEASSAEKWAAGIQSAMTIASGAVQVWQSSAQAGSKAAGAFQGAMSGAAAGSAFGPWGAAIGGVAGAITGLIHSLTAGRRAVEDFAASFGGFDEMHDALLKVGDAGEQMWKKLTQQTGRGDKAGALQTIKEAQDLIAAAPSTLAEQAGYKTKAELQALADQAKKVYDFMVSSGQYTAAQIGDAFAKMTAAQKDALGEAADAMTDSQKAAKAQLDELDAAYKQLYDSIKDEAPEEEMGVIERQTREHMKAIEDQMAAIPDVFADSTTAAGDATDQISGNLSDNADDWQTWADDATAQIDRVTKGLLAMPGPKAPTTGGVPSFAQGTGGKFLDFGSGTLAMLHGREAVVPAGSATRGAGGGTAILQINGRTMAEIVVPEIPGVVTRYGLAR